MTVHIIREQEVQQEAVDVLWRELGPAKMVRLWASWQLGTGDYLKQRGAWFAGESVGMLYEKIAAYQAEREYGEGEPGEVERSYETPGVRLNEV
jgi:hypothetical protein